VNQEVTPAGEAKVAKIVSLVVKVGALVFILFLPTKFALDLQLLGGVWILQTFPAVVFGLFVSWFRGPALLAGWAVGIAAGSWMAYADGLKPVHTLTINDMSYSMYTGLLALILNILVVAIVQLVLGKQRAPQTESGQPG